jgi:hypothetical protein
VNPRRATLESSHRKESNLAIGIGVCAGLTIACPALDCLQRGQVGIALVYSMLLGFRLTLGPEFWPKACLGGLVLAWPVVVKLIPALPVSFVLLQLWFAALLRGRTRRTVSRAVGFTAGLALGAFLLLFAIPGTAIGWAKNLNYLHEWAYKVAANENVGKDAMFQIDSTSNQSLTNAEYLFADTCHGVARDASTDRERLALDESIAQRHRSDRFTRLMADTSRAIVLVLLAAVTIKLSQERSKLAEAATFGLSSLSIVLISPLAWGHYFVFALPAALFVPLWLRRNGRRTASYLAAAGLPAMTWMHYVLKPWCGPIGLLGLGTATWFLAVCVVALFFTVPSSDLQRVSGSSRIWQWYDRRSLGKS